ncbi:HNH endonuclease [Bacillus amyloliquefaciens]|uniref:HNH endonuclease n=1 Tax=Bacillus amyloliquefaciens TaxID=1390 RepID=UPI0022825B77|nr:HNH endonuclease [Bacillus amyloliquefaciens]MCY7423508.1 HNH endonuclease [Bacillus amyloliquefaciens]MEC0966115.1 HNH endonuclease [Bacillus amyloliquefaciens]MEC1012986.1 HNH endonuclease [Bacillus amyloliquefaciens]
MAETAKIQLSKGKVALVDADMFDYLNQWSWFYHENGYAMRSYRKDGRYRKDRMHRVVVNAPSGFDVDHINGNKLDNRRENLRIATRSQNNANKRMQSNNTSGYRGVNWHKQRRKWVAKIQVDRKSIHLGLYEKKEDAARAYNKAAVLYYGEFAQLNNIKEESA